MGLSQTGKSSLAGRFLNNSFAQDGYRPTDTCAFFVELACTLAPFELLYALTDLYAAWRPLPSPLNATQACSRMSYPPSSMGLCFRPPSWILPVENPTLPLSPRYTILSTSYTCTYLVKNRASHTYFSSFPNCAVVPLVGCGDYCLQHQSQALVRSRQEICPGAACAFPGVEKVDTHANLPRRSQRYARLVPFCRVIAFLSLFPLTSASLKPLRMLCRGLGPPLEALGVRRCRSTTCHPAWLPLLRMQCSTWWFHFSSPLLYIAHTCV